MSKLSLSVMTPYATLAAFDDLDMVTCPGVDGDLGIMAGHLPLITALKKGEIQGLKGKKALFSMKIAAENQGSVHITNEGVKIFLQAFCPLSQDVNFGLGALGGMVAMNSAQFGLYKIDSNALPLITSETRPSIAAYMTDHPVAVITREWLEAVPSGYARVAAA